MKRSVRNGIAVVGMTGGLWFLGHAVANAADVPTTTPAGTVAAAVVDPGQATAATTPTGTTTVGTSTNGNATDLSGGDANGGTGGGNAVSGNTGATGSQPTGTSTDTTKPAPSNTQLFGGDASKPVTTVTIVTGDASANQQANGGDVATSGNVTADPSTLTQSAASHNDVTSTSTGGDKGDKGKDGDKSGSQNGSSSSQSTGSSHQDSSSSNDEHGHGGKNVADSSNDNSTTITGGDVSGGNGGSNSVDINTGLINTTFNCPPQSTCVYNITTGNVTVFQQANGGNVSDSGNVNIGTKQPPAATPTPAAPVVKTVAKKSPVKALSSAQPKGTLAVTGAETSTPLTAGLIALGAGTALTLAGRRRREAQAA